MMFGIRFRMALYGIAFIAIVVAIAKIALGYGPEFMCFFPEAIILIVGLVLVLDALLNRENTQYGRRM